MVNKWLKLLRNKWIDNVSKPFPVWFLWIVIAWQVSFNIYFSSCKFQNGFDFELSNCGILMTLTLSHIIHFLSPCIKLLWNFWVASFLGGRYSCPSLVSTLYISFLLRHFVAISLIVLAPTPHPPLGEGVGG